MNPFAEHKILGHLPILGQYLDGQVYAPIQVEIDLCNACTSACPWCAGYKEREDNPFILFGQGSTKNEQWYNSHMRTMKLVKQLADYGVQALTWTGGGDPSVHPYLSELIESSADELMDNGLITNGVIPVLECLPNCEWVRFSVDAGTEATYEKQHGRKNHFHRVLDNISNAVAYKRHNRLPVTIGVACVTSQEVLGELEQFVQLWHDIPVDYIQFRPLLDTHGQAFFNDNNETLEWLQRAKEIDSRVVTSETKYGKLGCSGLTKRCHGSSLETAIAADGCVYECCHLKGNPKYSLGSLHIETFQAIWERHLARGTFDTTPDCVRFCRHYGTNVLIEDLLSIQRQHPNFI